MKTNKMKMLSGELYDSSDNELFKERVDVKDRVFDYNNLRPWALDERDRIIRLIIGVAGENVFIETPFFCDYGYNITVGNNFYSNHNLVILDAASVEFGDNVFIGPNVGIYTVEHHLNPFLRSQYVEYAKPVKIGNDVWIGGGVTILRGVTIGDNCVIGAGSIVTKDIPENSIAVGNPCRVIRKNDK